jgi:hypothetical protein
MVYSLWLLRAEVAGVIILQPSPATLHRGPAVVL